MDYVKLILELNEELYKKVGEIGRDFSYSTNGLEEIIEFGEIIIWHSEDSKRIWDDEKKKYEPFKPFIKRMYNETIKDLNIFKF